MLQTLFLFPDRTMTATAQKLTLRQLQELAQQGKAIKVLTPSGYQPITKVFLNGKKQVFLFNGVLPITGDHELFTLEGEKVPAHTVKVGDVVQGENGPITIESIDNFGVKDVGDIQVGHESHRYFSHGFVVSNCGSCTSQQEVQHLSSKHKPIERGEDWVKKIEAIKRDDSIAQKLLVEVWQDSGPYSVMHPNFFRHAINRALLMGARTLGWDLVESLIYEKHNNTRQLYRIKAEDFKSMVSGSSVYEVAFNALFVFTPEKVAKLLEAANQYLTKGWRIRSIKIVSSDFILKNNLKFAMTTFRFDSRKVNHDTVNLPMLKELIASYPKRTVKYKEQVRVNKQVVRTKTVVFDKSKTLSLSAGMGRNSYETVLRVIGEIENVHPLIWLAGFLSDSSNPKSYPSIYGTDIIVEGFYTNLNKIGASVFDLAGSSHQNSTQCPKCGATRALNVLTGLPFGEADNEVDPILAHKYGKVCHTCFLTEAS